MEPPKLNETLSEDFVPLECAGWSKQERMHYEDLNAEFGFFQLKGARL